MYQIIDVDAEKQLTSSSTFLRKLQYVAATNVYFANHREKSQSFLMSLLLLFFWFVSLCIWSYQLRSSSALHINQVQPTIPWFALTNQGRSKRQLSISLKWPIYLMNSMMINPRFCVCLIVCHTCWPWWKVKKIAHSHTHVLTKYDEG